MGFLNHLSVINTFSVQSVHVTVLPTRLLVHSFILSMPQSKKITRQHSSRNASCLHLFTITLNLLKIDHSDSGYHIYDSGCHLSIHKHTYTVTVAVLYMTVAVKYSDSGCQPYIT